MKEEMSRRTRAKNLTKLIEDAKRSGHNKVLIKNYERQLYELQQEITQEKRDIQIAKYVGL